jgi:hypothetical protein
MVQDRRKMLLEHAEETVVALSTGDVTSDLRCPLAVEIDIRRSIIEKQV